MLILISLLSLVICIFLNKRTKEYREIYLKNYQENESTKRFQRNQENVRSYFSCKFMLFLSTICFFIFFSFSCLALYSIVNAYTIDDTIKLYENENAKIEKSIDEIVTDYLQHEHNGFVDLEKSPINLVTLYPELNSNKLVSKQLETYISNDNKIIELKEMKINIAKIKWILYFGK